MPPGWGHGGRGPMNVAVSGKPEWNEPRGRHVCGHRHGARAGRAPAETTARATPDDLDRAGGGNRHFEEHAVAARDRSAAADFGAPPRTVACLSRAAG